LNNPFDLPLQKAAPESREAFSPEELRLIGNHLNDFVRPIFIIDIYSGLSEGDICLMKWSEIRNGWITWKRRKTGALLDIPILPPLAEFLAEQRTRSEGGEYVLPEHADMYQNTFAYIAGVYQIPLPVVQSILGHMSQKMTRHDQAHADREAKEKYLAQMPDFIGVTDARTLGTDAEAEQSRLIQLIQTLAPDQLKAVAAFIDSR